MNKKWAYSIGIFLALVIVLSLFAPIIIKNEIVKRLDRLEKQWNGIVDYEDLSVQGLTVSFSKLYLSGNDTLRDPFFAVKNLTVTFSLWNIITQNPLPEFVRLDTAYLNIYHNSRDTWNFSRQQGDTSNLTNDNSKIKWLDKLYWMINQPFKHNLPQVLVNNLNIDFSFENDHLRFVNLFLLSNDDSLKLAGIDQNGFLISFNGKFNSDSLYFTQNVPVRFLIPLPGKDNLTIGSDSGIFVIKKIKSGVFDFYSQFKQMEIRTPGIADQTVMFEKISHHSLAVFSSDRHEVDLKHNITINDLEIQNQITYSENTVDRAVNLSLSIPPINSFVFHESIPKPLLGELYSFYYTGKLGYHLKFVVNFDQLDSLQLEGEIIKDKFKIVNEGVSFAKLDSDFYQPVYDGLTIQREILIGKSNPNFVRFEDLPPYLVQAIVTSEDGSFFRHKGFNEDAIRESLITNLKEKKFKRGASTISMQFVKNIFLNRQKNLARKFQELFITWMLELEQPISKERMFEIYINMIEFGPDIYGINEAATYYFNKSAKNLTLQESLFLASIIPAPKKFFRRFDKEGNLTRATIETMEFVATKMKQFQRIAPESVDTLSFVNFKIMGKALELITPFNSITADSTDDE